MQSLHKLWIWASIPPRCRLVYIHPTVRMQPSQKKLRKRPRQRPMLKVGINLPRWWKWIWAAIPHGYMCTPKSVQQSSYSSDCLFNWCSERQRLSAGHAHLKVGINLPRSQSSVKASGCGHAVLHGKIQYTQQQQCPAISEKVRRRLRQCPFEDGCRRPGKK